MKLSCKLKQITVGTKLCFVASRGLPAEFKDGDAQRISDWSRCKGRFGTHTFTYIHVLTVAALVSRKAMKAVVSPMAGSGGVCFLREFGVMRSLCVPAFGRNLASVAVQKSSHLILFKKGFYEFGTFSARCKDNTTLIYVTLEHKMFHSPEL
jgi:hypothetical protein